VGLQRKSEAAQCWCEATEKGIGYKYELQLDNGEEKDDPSHIVLIIYPSQSREIPNREGIPCTFDDEGPDEAESFL
jgi:hypothetical protein